jgi:DNA adenine methylase
MMPFLKWAGGKRWLVSQHDTLFRQGAKRYIEPFLGSGAVFFYMQPRSAILSDLNTELVSAYQALRDAPLKVKRHLLMHHRMHSVDHYYRVRQQTPRTVATRAARFIYLNRTCFNGLYRVNLQGVFNVPKGTKDKVVLPSDDFSGVSALLRTTDLAACDFSDTISRAKSGDFLYIDPPYTARHNNNNFLKYNERIFSWADQKRLAACLAEAAKRGASILLSNADHTCIHELYRAACWQRLAVGRFSRLASSSEYRKRTTEVIISNYLNKNGEQEDPRY